MHFVKTRPYASGKLLWGALTSKLTPLLGIKNYYRVGNFLKKAMRFGYLYPYVNNHLFLPRYTEKGLMFDSLPQNGFEKKLVRSMTSAAIDLYTLSAEEGMLHEIEFVSPYTIDKGEPVFMKGLFWVKEFSENGFSMNRKNNSLLIKYNDVNIDFTEDLANILQIGGERRYGFGLIELSKETFCEIGNRRLDRFSGVWSENVEGVCLTFESNQPIWSHILHSDKICIKGNIEPLVGRDWDVKKGSGRRLNALGLFWSPGSIIKKKMTFKINEFGLLLDLNFVRS
jgi:hypothetical protein